ncbi:MAG: bifunctional proline dehydrogenase/L-glutamate gamma-semialdehyde dehydrogenase PutA [Pseudomonadota bacterium]
MNAIDHARAQIRADHLADEAELLSRLVQDASFSVDQRQSAARRAARLVEAIRADDAPGLMEVFLAEYGLSTEEGIALMCLAEALLRVPDAETVDALIEDKIAPSEWGAHLGQSSSPLVNASTWALLLTGKVLQDGRGAAAVLKDALRRLGEPVIRAAVGRAMREMGAQFVLGETIDAAVARGADRVREGYSFSFDMLGEAARTDDDAQGYFHAYMDAINRLAQEAGGDLRTGPGISIKLSALHPRYEESQRDKVMAELVPRALSLALKARELGMGLNIDAEEADRLELSLDVIEAVLSDPRLGGWDGFGIVVQAYGKRASAVIGWFHALSEDLDRRVMLRLVKGAYWDTEIKRAQVEGLSGFPVWTRKAATDVAYLACAKQLLGLTDRIYPQFATHNAHSVAAILELGAPADTYEFQRLHGMGESLHDKVLKADGTRCRIYAPVGAHRDLLAYLVRRLLENGANSSFVNQIVDPHVPAEVVAADPFDTLARAGDNRAVVSPTDLFEPERRNARGWDLHDRDDISAIERARAPFQDHCWEAGPLIKADVSGAARKDVRNPANPDEIVGHIQFAGPSDVAAAITAATPWAATPSERAQTLIRASDLYEARYGEIFALLCREAGKTPRDAIAELREAVDFLRYYAARGRELDAPARGVITCISPWNFPLAIFTGQIAAALAAGNAVLAKPAEATGLIACLAVSCLYEAGVPRSALQLLPGEGHDVGAALTSEPRVDGVCYTGSTATAQAINRSMARALDPSAPLIAETGGLNAMIVDSTALPEQAVRDIVVSAFQSAGQRCSALRVLYLQEDVEDVILNMLFGAMDALSLGDPWEMSADVGPVIDAAAQDEIARHIETARSEGRLLKMIKRPQIGHFVGPAVIRVGGIDDIGREIFGPVLHVASFRAEALDRVVDAVNQSGYGLTFGIHSRIDDRVDRVAKRLKVGNIYVNRNQIGAIVGSQPFGGEGLSGTGPKAGGPAYVPRFAKPASRHAALPRSHRAPEERVQAALDAATPVDGALSVESLPGPTGESNRLSVHPRGIILCLGPTLELAQRQARIARGAGCGVVLVAPGAEGPDAVPGVLDRTALTRLEGFNGVALASDPADLKTAREALARRDGPIIPLLSEDDLDARVVLERHLCVDTTAAGGNARLLAQSG